MHIHTTLAVGLAAASLCSQGPTHFSPAEAALALGTVNNSYPFAISPNSYQQVHSLSSFSTKSLAVFQKMSFRNARGFLNQVGKTIDVEIFLANSPLDATNASGTYASNIVASTQVNVVLRKMVSLPQIMDNSWAITFPFDNQFIFTATSDLSWRATVYGNSNGNAGFTYQIDAWTGQGTNVITGNLAGCKSATGTANATHTIFAPSLKLGESVQFTGNSFVPAGGLPAVLTLGASASSYAGIPLPFDLTPFGAPSCSIVSDILAQVPGTTAAGANGAVTILVPLPLTPGLAGAVFYSQYVFLDPAANALGLFTSNGRTDTIGTPYGVTRIYGGLTATGGTRERYFGLAVGFN